LYLEYGKKVREEASQSEGMGCTLQNWPFSP